MKLLSIKLAVKNLLSRKNSSLISIFGLAIAFVSVFYIYSYVSFEMNYDTHHKNADRIYRISGDIIAAENTMTHAVLGPLMGQGLKDEFPAVANFTSLLPIHRSILLERENIKYTIEEAYTVDNSVFDIFTIHFIYGDINKALTKPHEVVINQSLSLKIFGDKNPLGEVLKKGDQLLTIAGVISDAPKNSHHKLNVLFSREKPWAIPEGISATQLSEGYWMPSAFHFILLKPGTQIESITKNFDGFYNKNMAEFGKAINAQFVPVAIPLNELHFSQYMSYDYPKGNKTYTYILIIVAIFILLIAFINYSNLLISQNNSEAKNIGIKKIVGASHLNLYWQFFMNSLFFILCSILLGLLIFQVTMPWLKHFTKIEFSALYSGKVLKLSLILLLGTNISVSLIPFLNQFSQKGIQLLKVDVASQLKLRNIHFGKTSTIFQYALTILLIMTSIVITRQLSFLLSSDMGFNQENVVIIKLNDPEIPPETIVSFKDDLLKISSVNNISFSTNVPGDILGSSHFQIKRDGQTVTKIVNTMGIDYSYIPLMGMELTEGRNFDRTFNDGNYQSAIINEAFINFCGYDSGVVGTQIEETTVIGVLKDACFNSLHNPAEPVVFYLSEEPVGYLNIKLNDNSQIPEALNLIKHSWNDFFGKTPINLQFLDNRVEKMYEDDQKKSTLLKIFTLVSLTLSIMGLLNLSTLMVKRKTKEIGIRKVNGARISQVLVMLNKNFVKWVAIAFVIATPIAYYAMHKWLQNFAYKTELSWWIFGLAGIMALGIALLTVSWQSWRAARQNPVEALRYE